MVLLPELPAPQITKTGIVDGKDTFVSPILQMSLKCYMILFGSKSANLTGTQVISTSTFNFPLLVPREYNRDNNLVFMNHVLDTKLLISEHRHAIERCMHLLHRPAPPEDIPSAYNFNLATADLYSKLAGHDAELEQLFAFFSMAGTEYRESDDGLTHESLMEVAEDLPPFGGQTPRGRII